MYSCQYILECYNLFSRVKSSINRFILLYELNSIEAVVFFIDLKNSSKRLQCNLPSSSGKRSPNSV